ncbi:MAG: hypothetical protein KAU21_01695, partial [Gammaproteobacteria bacterium]|nr:hypothetical protein [Gammaproteobacteria bacterium]
NQRDITMFKLLITFTLFTLSVPLFAEQVNTDTPKQDQYRYTIRYNKGGFNDNRSPLGKLGGGQVAFDIRLKDSPLSILISSEFYTNSQFPTNNYEISNFDSINLLYSTDFPLIKNTSMFIGGGIGRLSVPGGGSIPDSYVSTDALSLELGLYLRPYEQFGFHAVLKHLQADRDVNNTKIIDFNETIFLIGINYDFNLSFL